MPRLVLRTVLLICIAAMAAVLALAAFHLPPEYSAAFVAIAVGAAGVLMSRGGKGGDGDAAL